MLEIENLTVAYGDHVVLQDCQLACSYHQIHGVLGMNGAGKTTLFNTLYGFVKARKGEILLDGKPIHNRQISFLETSNYFYPYLTGREYLELLALRQDNFDIEDWNRLFELPLDSLVDQYSTGMKKKLAFLGNLALDRPVIILDEPFNGVDIESNEKMYQILQRLKTRKKIILCASHIISSLTGICDRISYLKGGRFVKTYAPNDFPALEEELRILVHQKIDETLNELLG